MCWVVLLRSTITKAKKGADIKLKCVSGLEFEKLLVLTAVHAGHANGHDQLEDLR